MNIKINEQCVEVEEGTTVAVALMNSDVKLFRRSITGMNREPFCGMGVCFECRARINGITHERTCMILCRDGMELTVP